MPDIGGGSQQVVQRNVSEPPKYLEPHLKTVAEQAGKLYGQGTGPSFYPGQTYIPPTEQELAGMNSIEAQARMGTGLGQGLLGNMQGPLQDIISGKNAIDIFQPGEANPHLMGVLDTAAGRTRDMIESSLGGMGALGGGEHGQILARELGNLYQSGLSNQMNLDLDRMQRGQATNIANQAGAIGQYAGMAPTADQLMYADPQRLINVGAAQRGELQSELGQNIARFNAEQQRPWDQLGLYNNMLSGLTSTGGTTTAYGPQGSPIAGILGGAATGAGIGGVPGAIGGGLLGAFI